MKSLSEQDLSQLDENGSRRTPLHSTAVRPSESPLSDAILGNDPPIEEAHPGLQPALVFLAYPLGLIALLCLAMAFFFFGPKNERKSENAPQPTQPVPADISIIKIP